MNTLDKQEMEYKRVVAVQDESSHWYVIPYELKNDFYAEQDTEQDTAQETEDWNAFEDKFGEYMTGGDLNLTELYIKDGE